MVPAAHAPMPPARSLLLLGFLLAASACGGWLVGRGRRRHAADGSGSDQRFRRIVRGAPVGICIVSPDGHFLEVNGAAERLVGWEPGELVGRPVWELLHPDDMKGVRDDFARALAGASDQFEGERRYRRKDGTHVWLQIFTVLEREPDGTPRHFVAQVIDINERRLAETALRASEERYRGIVESQQAAVMRIGLDFRIRFANERCSAIIGVPAAEMVDQDFTQWIYDADRDQVVTTVASQIALPPHRAQAVSRVKCAGGDVRWFEWEGTAVLDPAGIPVELQAVGHDVHERRVAEEALRASLETLRQREQQLRLLAERQVSVREEERRRVGFDLHDGVCQELTGIGILVESVRRRLALDGDDSATLERAIRYLNRLVEHLRKLAGELRPMLLADLGLEGSLRSLATGSSSDTTKVRATFTSVIPRLPEKAELGIYRIVQEAVANALRHAEPRQVDVSVGVWGHEFCVEVRDDGRGFDPGNRRSQALGLVGIEERAQALGASLEISSAPECGTTVRVALPLKPEATARA